MTHPSRKSSRRGVPHLRSLGMIRRRREVLMRVGPPKGLSDLVWRLMRQWPTSHITSFSLQLSHLAMARHRTPSLDIGLHDKQAGLPVYVVAARGEEHVALLTRAVALTMTGRGMDTKLLAAGDGSFITPYSRVGGKQ